MWLASREKYFFLVHSELTDPTMPSGYHEVMFDADEHDVTSAHRSTGGLTDPEAVADYWVKYWIHHGITGTVWSSSMTTHLDSEVHDIMRRYWDSPDFQPSPTPYD